MKLAFCMEKMIWQKISQKKYKNWTMKKINLCKIVIENREERENNWKKESIPLKTKFVKKIQKKNIGQYLTLYSFDGPFQLLKADVANLEFLENLLLIWNTVCFSSIFSYLKSALIQQKTENLLQNRWNVFTKISRTKGKVEK